MRCLRWRVVGMATLAGLVVTALAADRSRNLSRDTKPTISHPKTGVEDPRRVPVPDPNVRPTAIRSSSRTSEVLGAGAVTSPGIPICASGTIWDLQHPDDGQRQIATLGSGALIHFTWQHWDVVSESIDVIERYVNYIAYSSSSGPLQGGCGVVVSGGGGDPRKAFGGFSTIALGPDSAAHVSFLQHDESGGPPWTPPLSSWEFGQNVPGSTLFDGGQFPHSEDHDALYPHLAVDREGAPMPAGTAVYHVVSRCAGRVPVLEGYLYYWRRVGEFPGIWEGPVVIDVDPVSFSHHVAVDPTSENLAVVYVRDDLDPNRLLQTVYMGSSLNGADWIATGGPAFPTPLTQLGFSPVAVTNYTDADGPQSWLECTGEYDLDGRLHIVWVEQAQANVSSDCRIMHWDDATQSARVVAEALGFANEGGDGARDLWLAYPQIAFGDGSTLCTDGPLNPGTAGGTSNRDYIYVTYEQYGGPTATEGADHSAALSDGGPVQNLEIYLAASNDRGATWAPPVNLTNTKTPGCDGTPGNECASENYASISQIVDDTIHISYLLDIDAGDAVFGQGWWTYNPVMYYRIPGGTDAAVICPEIAPRLSASLSNQNPDCSYHAAFTPQGTQAEALTIGNLGNAPLAGTIAVSPPGATWLQLATGVFAIAPGDPADIRPVVMNAGDPSITGEGVYHADIEITHDDPSLASPYVIPVDFLVLDGFVCPEYQTLNTGALWLRVGNTGSYGGDYDSSSAFTRLAGDSSHSIYDASLLIGLLPTPDTIVYRNIYGQGPGQPGFIARDNLIIDTSAYGTAAGQATAEARMLTVDSSLAIDVRYVFPQNPDSNEFVLAEYHIENVSDTVSPSLTLGDVIDFDVIPGPKALRRLQYDAENTAHADPDWNLLYQQGKDTATWGIPNPSATQFKAGATVISCVPLPRGLIASAEFLNSPEGFGFHDGYLYREMQETGLSFKPWSDADLHSMIVFEQNTDLGPGETRDYTLGLVSSNVGIDDSTELINTTRKAWRAAFGWQSVVIADTIEGGTPMSYPYRVLGVHEDGVGSGCCGCVVEKMYGSPVLNIVPGPDPCAGTIELDAVSACCFPNIAFFKVTDLCGTYEDIIRVAIYATTECLCDCPHQGDIDGDSFPTTLDMAALIDILFAGELNVRDASCPNWRSDLDCDCFATSLDLADLIDFLFVGGQPPCNPCTDGSCGLWCDVTP